MHRELGALSDGETIFTKDATYGDFLKIATDGQKRCFVFSSVRNPALLGLEQQRPGQSDGYTAERSLLVSGRVL